MPLIRRSAAPRRPMARRRGVPAAALDIRAGAPSDGMPAGAITGGADTGAGMRGRRRWTSPARIGIASVAAVLCGIAVVGAFSPSPVAGGGGSSPAAAGTAASTAAPSLIGAAWGGSGGIDPIDLITKGALVLVLLFITLRVLGRMQTSGPKRSGSLNVLESRTLASKASLHLVAVGDRRLVVGLTPSGMVALAELDAAELEEARTAESPLDEAGALTPRGERTGAQSRGPASGSVPAPFAATLNSLLAPIDNVTDRLAGFFNGGRAR